MNTKRIGMVLIVVALLLAIYVAADFTLKTQSGDVKLFGQGQTTLGIGINKATDYPIIKGIGAGSIGLTNDQTNSYTSLDIYPTGTGTTSYLQLYGKGQIDSSSVSKLIMLHDNVNGKIYTYATGSGVTAGNIIINPGDGKVYIGADTTSNNGKALYARNLSLVDTTVHQWDSSENKYFDLELLEKITTKTENSENIWDLSGIVKKDAQGNVIQSILHTEVVPETELRNITTYWNVTYYNETLGRNITIQRNRTEEMRVNTGRMVNSTWVSVGELNGYLIGVNKALYEKVNEQNALIENLTARIEALEARSR